MKKWFVSSALALVVWLSASTAQAQIFFPAPVVPAPVFVPVPVAVPVVPAPVFVPPTTVMYSNVASPYGITSFQTIATPFGGYTTASAFATPYVPFRYGYNVGVFARPGRVVIFP